MHNIIQLAGHEQVPLQALSLSCSCMIYLSQADSCFEVIGSRVEGATEVGEGRHRPTLDMQLVKQPLT